MTATKPQDTAELLLELNLKLATHTYKAVKRRAEGMDSDEASRSFLLEALRERERSEEALRDGKGREE